MGDGRRAGSHQLIGRERSGSIWQRRGHRAELSCSKSGTGCSRPTSAIIAFASSHIARARRAGDSTHSLKTLVRALLLPRAPRAPPGKRTTTSYKHFINVGAHSRAATLSSRTRAEPSAHCMSSLFHRVPQPSVLHRSQPDRERLRPNTLPVRDCVARVSVSSS